MKKPQHLASEKLSNTIQKSTKAIWAIELLAAICYTAIKTTVKGGRPLF